MHEPAQSLAPNIVLGVAAHPDDLDFAAGGTMASFAKRGAQVFYLILTDGSKGSSDRAMTPEHLCDLRRAEQRRAGKILGVKDIFFLDYPDAELEDTQDLRRDIIKTIRQIKPDVLVALDPTMLYSPQDGIINHPDHRVAGQAALDAVYPLARDHMAFPELLQQGYEPHETPHVLLVRFTNSGTTFGMDITDTLDQKLQALDKHTSQFRDKEYLHNTVRQTAAEAGKMYDSRYAEAFVRIDIS